MSVSSAVPGKPCAIPWPAARRIDGSTAPFIAALTTSRAADLAGGERYHNRASPALFAAAPYPLRQVLVHLRLKRLQHAAGDIVDRFHVNHSFRGGEEQTTEGFGNVRKVVGEIRNE
jgi:hypothetical protein